MHLKVKVVQYHLFQISLILHQSVVAEVVVMVKRVEQVEVAVVLVVVIMVLSVVDQEHLVKDLMAARVLIGIDGGLALVEVAVVPVELEVHQQQE